MSTITAQSTTGATPTLAQPDRPRNPARRGPVVLATDGASRSGATALAAQLLATHIDQPLEVVTVLEPAPVYDGMLNAGLRYSSATEEARRDARETAVWDYVGRFLGGALPAGVHVRSGNVTQEIARFARDLSATAVVVGAAPHRRLRRVMSGERAAQVLRAVDCPVLSVPPTFSALPRIALVAVDFGPASVRAAQAALLLLGGGGTLILTHVLPPLMSPAALSAPHADDPAREVHALFDRLRDELTPYVPNGVKVETRLLTDDAVDGILASAEHVDADLVAIGTHGPGLFARLFMGSVAGGVMHSAERAVLAVPPPPAAEALELWRRVAGAATSDRFQEWAVALDAFTRRNAGGDVMLELNDPEGGGRVAAHGYELVGVTYEPAEHRVEIMIGDAERPLRHLTRSVQHPDAITMTTAAGGRGEMLDIRHGHGHTLVTVANTGLLSGTTR